MPLTAARDLYGLPLERFTEDRNALSKRLRQERRREEAAEVAKLRKPSVAAWAVNQLVRTQRRRIDALFDAGDMLQKAQADLLAGQADPGAFRVAVEAERAAVDQLTERAGGLLSSEGHDLAAAKLERVSETLHAAALDNEARTQVQDGCLQRELRHIGIGAMAETTSQEGTREKHERAARLKAARKRETDARRQTERTSRDLDVARRQRDRAAQALGEADDALVRAREAADEAALEQRRASAALDEL